jgi:hypothetical protein
MVLLREHEVFMVEAYFRNGTKVDGNWEYSVSACFEEFQELFPIVAIVYEQFRQTLHLCLNNFRESGTIGPKRRKWPSKQTYSGSNWECSTNNGRFTYNFNSAFVTTG